MKRLILTPDATGDLSDIRAYTVGKWGLDQADAYLREIGAAFGRIASGETISTAVGKRDFRKVRVRSHVIYFRENETAVRVVRVLHGSMDAEWRLG